MVNQVTNFGRSGLSDWLVQRATAVILAAYFITIVCFRVCNPDVTYEQWKDFFDCTAMKALSSAAILAIVSHAWIGLWAVTTDYMTTRLMGTKGTILRLLFHHIVTSESAHEFAANGIDRLYKMAESQFGAGSDKELEWLIGRSLIQMSK